MSKFCVLLPNASADPESWPLAARSLAAAGTPIVILPHPSAKRPTLRARRVPACEMLPQTPGTLQPPSLSPSPATEYNEFVNAAHYLASFASPLHRPSVIEGHKEASSKRLACHRNGCTELPPSPKAKPLDHGTFAANCLWLASQKDTPYDPFQVPTRIEVSESELTVESVFGMLITESSCAEAPSCTPSSFLTTAALALDSGLDERSQETDCSSLSSPSARPSTIPITISAPSRFPSHGCPDLIFDDSDESDSDHGMQGSAKLPPHDAGFGRPPARAHCSTQEHVDFDSSYVPVRVHRDRSEYEQERDWMSNE